MSVMSTLATELELYWAPFGNGENPSSYTRQMPNGYTAMLSQYLGANGARGWTLGYGEYGEFVEHYDTLVGALVAAGQIAREQLADQARTWAA